MISLKEAVTIAAPPAAVWPLLRDPALVASCIPGATLSASGEDGTYQGTVRVKFGPTVAMFRGEARLAYDDDARRCTIEGRGIDGRGASRAVASGVVTASGASGTGTTTLACEGNFTVTGPLETFANAGGVHLARALLAEFAANLARLAAERAPPVAEVEPALDASGAAQPSLSAAIGESGAVRRDPSPSASAAAPELRGGALLWRAFLGWLRQMFFAKEKPRKGNIQ
ncbi:MAG TPA: SRPBCC family protein [Stellaceae bacterium]|nr:SRPBCC family protein [Stellaceae bacterium]